MNARLIAAYGMVVLVGTLAPRWSDAAELQVNGQTTRGFTSMTDANGVTTRVFTLEVNGLVREPETKASEALHITTILTIKIEGGMLSDLSVQFVRHTGDQVSIVAIVVPCGLNFITDTKVTPEQFGAEVVGEIQSALLKAEAQVIVPCGVQLLTGFLADAGARGLLRF